VVLSVHSHVYIAKRPGLRLVTAVAFEKKLKMSMHIGANTPFGVQCVGHYT